MNYNSLHNDIGILTRMVTPVINYQNANMRECMSLEEGILITLRNAKLINIDVGG